MLRCLALSVDDLALAMTLKGGAEPGEIAGERTGSCARALAFQGIEPAIHQIGNPSGSSCCAATFRIATSTSFAMSFLSMGRPEERRLHCHSQGYDMVERPLVRHDEPNAARSNMVVACHPTYATQRTYSWICDNFLIGERDVA